ncbi:MAG: LamG domain-containing protein [Candidatus Omnitrophota bacterium]
MIKRCIFGAMLFIVGMFLISGRCFCEEKGPIGYWKFDEGQGDVAKDSSGNDNDGKVIKLAEYSKWVDGKFGKALEFSGAGPETRGENGCVIIPEMGKYDYSKGLTIEAWVKLNDKHKRSDSAVIMFAEINQFGFNFCFTYGSLYIRSCEGGDGKGCYTMSTAAKNPVEKNVWYHFAATYNDSIFKVYINGEECAVSELNVPLTKWSNVITIGSYMEGFAYPFNGIIDEVKLYDYPRTALDILKDANIF